MSSPARDPLDTPQLRKARGAFFTPAPIASFIADWAIRDAGDRVLEPSSGDAEFLVHATHALRRFGAQTPEVWGAELHEWSARAGAQRVEAVGGLAYVSVGDFFTHHLEPQFDAVIGNPPYIRFQDFAGDQRARARAAALRGGVALSGLASAWAAFTVHAALHLAPGGRLGFVLPAELLAANYASPVRSFLLERFAKVELVLFEQRVFPEAETEAVLLLADGYGSSTKSVTVRQATNAAGLANLSAPIVWEPADPGAKWSGMTVAAEAAHFLSECVSAGTYAPLAEWGDTRLGMVTGRNAYFALTPEQVRDLGLGRRDTLLVSPPGSGHLRGLELTSRALSELGKHGKQTRLFYPHRPFTPAAQTYMAQGESEGVPAAYKCRVRKHWWQVPLLPPADLLLTYMNADTVRMVTNTARAHHLNSVHGVYLRPEHRELAAELLPLAALNSLTMLSAELAGRAYGGGVLKMEPGEAARWLVPSPESVAAAASDLRAVRSRAAEHLRRGRLGQAVQLVDGALVDALSLDPDAMAAANAAREQIASRRMARSQRA